jgi:hypothetical protein
MRAGSTLRLVLTLAAVALSGFAWARIGVVMQEREEARVAAGLVRDSLAAAADSTRALHLRLEVLGESLRVVQRRAVQTEQRADALDRALGLERVARVRLAARVAPITRSARSDTVVGETSEGERSAAFDVREAPYTVHAEVRLPPPPAAGMMAVRVALDTLGLEVRVSCGVPGEAGVRPATATVLGPSWATIRMTKVEQSPDVCAGAGHRPAPNLFAAARRWLAERAGVAVGFGVVRDARGALITGPGVVVGVRAWP